jgi:hypothetical protein
MQQINFVLNRNNNALKYVNNEDDGCSIILYRLNYFTAK